MIVTGTNRTRAGWITALVCYNRPELLRNVVKSIDSFDCSEHVCIFDDGSHDPNQLQLLEEIDGKGRFEVFFGSVDRREATRRGGLHHNLNRAIDVARSRGFTYLNVIQDDMQLVDSTWDAYAACEILLETHDLNTFQVHLAFHKYLGPRWLVLSNHDCYVHSRLALAHTGAIRLKNIDLPLFPEDDPEASEITASRPHREEGRVLLGIRNPCVCWVPWPSKFEYGSLQASSAVRHLPGDQLMMTPLGTRETSALRSRNLEEFPFHEDYLRPAGWWCLFPYEYGPATFPTWARLNWYKWRAGDFRFRYIPRIVGNSPHAGPGRSHHRG